MKNILVISFIMITLNVFGQVHRVGLTGGVNMTNISIVTPEIEFDNKTGILAGLTYDVLLTKHFSLGTGLQYNQRGFKYEFLYTDENADSLGMVTNVFNYNYISLPIKTGFTFGNKFNAFVNIGVMPSFLLNANQKTPQLNPDGTIREIITIEENRGVRKFDIAGLAEIGVGYKFLDSYWLFTSFTYQHSASTIKNSAFYSDLRKPRHRGWMFDIGVKYAL